MKGLNHMSAEESYDEMVKFIIIGDTNVGKTSFLNRFCYGTYKKKVPCTVGLEYGQKVTKVVDKRVLIQLWDTAGQEKFRSLTPSFYRSAMAIILMFSVDNRDSFNSIAIWIKQIANYAAEDIPILLVGNKADLTKKQVSEKQCVALAAVNKLDLVMISCQENINIDESVIRLYKMIKSEGKNGEQEKKYGLGGGEERRRICSC